jgi:predicted HicB family RNase H-like nuclease
MSKERISDQIVIRVTPSLRARLEQEAERVGLELSSLAREALEDRVQLPQQRAA